jgi:hypothetical protein
MEKSIIAQKLTKPYLVTNKHGLLCLGTIQTQYMPLSEDMLVKNSSVACLPSKRQALSSTPSTAERRKKESLEDLHDSTTHIQYCQDTLLEVIQAQLNQGQLKSNFEHACIFNIWFL